MTKTRRCALLLVFFLSHSFFPFCLSFFVFFSVSPLVSLSSLPSSQRIHDDSHVSACVGIQANIIRRQSRANNRCTSNGIKRLPLQSTGRRHEPQVTSCASRRRSPSRHLTLPPFFPSFLLFFSFRSSLPSIYPSVRVMLLPPIACRIVMMCDFLVKHFDLLS